jgi:hypothetical protein
MEQMASETPQIDDDRALAAVRALRTSSGLSFRVDRAEGRGRFLELEIEASTGRSVWLRISSPSTGREQYWLYVTPVDERDWAEQLVAWIEEEVGTGGLTSSRSRIEEDGRSFVVAVPYGWRLADDAQHRRLEAAVPPGGWYEPSP